MDDDLLRHVRSMYKKAEDVIATLGMEYGAVVPAINELRYAGHHILNGTTSESEEVRTEQYQRALRHCERAVYEAYDGAVFHSLAEFQEFKKDYRTVVVTDVVPNYIEISQAMSAAKRLLEQARSDSVDRADYYKEVEKNHKKLADHAEVLEASRDELNKRVNANYKDTRRTWLIVAVGVASTLLGVVIRSLF